MTKLERFRWARARAEEAALYAWQTYDDSLVQRTFPGHISGHGTYARFSAIRLARQSLTRRLREDGIVP